MTEEILPGVKRTILVLSGKGGVGKSTVATQLALAFQQSGKKVSIVELKHVIYACTVKLITLGPQNCGPC
jgi:Mrp family chromosome partitioning ATPase